MARHKLADHWRRRGREERVLWAVQAGATAVDDPWDEQLDVLRARDALSGLSPPHRAALTLRYLDGMTVPEVAVVLERTLHATEALLVRARRQLRAAYEEGGGDV